MTKITISHSQNSCLSTCNDKMVCIHSPCTQPASLKPVRTETTTKSRRTITSINVHVTNSIKPIANNATLTPFQTHLRLPDAQYSQLRDRPQVQPLNIINLTTESNSSITSFENVVYPNEVIQLGAISRAINLIQKQTWSPPLIIPIRRGLRLIEEILPSHLEELIIPTLQQNPNDVILYQTRSRIQNITTEHLRKLITHGSVTNDAIQNTFLEILCTQHQMYYLCTFFFSILRRDRSWSAVQDWFLQLTNSYLPNPRLTPPSQFSYHAISRAATG